LLSSDEIPPGGEGKLAVKISSGYRRRQLRQAVNVRSNDPVNGLIKVFVTANVLVNLEIIPNILRFSPKQSDIASVRIKNHSEDLVQLRDIHTSNNYVDISLSSMQIPPKGAVTVTAKLLPEVPKGVLSGWLTMQTDLKSFPTLQIRMFGNIP
jgi:hypothetical protein